MTTKMSTEVIIGLIITTLISVILLLWQIRANRKLAREIGEFKHDIPVTRFLNRNLYNDVVYFVIYGANISDEKQIYIEFPIEIGNVGEKTIEDIHFSMSFPHNSTLPYDKEFIPKPSKSGIPITRKFIKSKDEKLINYQIQSIHPDVIHILGEYLTIKKSSKEDLESFNIDFINDFIRSLQNKSHPTKYDFVTRLVSKNNKPYIVFFKTFLFACKNLEELVDIIDYPNLIKIYGYPDNIFTVMLELEKIDSPNSEGIKIGKILIEKSGVIHEKKKR